jgi:isochorismate synthase EntC
MPVQAALDWIARLEPEHRGWYSGPIGWVGRERSVLAVALRSALVKGGECFAFAGAGLVRGSDPESEWRETALKLTTVERALVAKEGVG